MRKFLVAGLLPLLLLACATQRGPLPVPESLLQEDPFDARYKVHCDDASGKTVCVMTGNALRPFSPRYPLLTLGAVSEADKDGSPRYFLRTVFVNEGRWLNIGRGSSLRITIDGEPVELSGPGSRGSRYTGEDKKLYEVALFDASAAIMQKDRAGQGRRREPAGRFPAREELRQCQHALFPAVRPALHRQDADSGQVAARRAAHGRIVLPRGVFLIRMRAGVHEDISSTWLMRPTMRPVFCRSMMQRWASSSDSASSDPKPSSMKTDSSLYPPAADCTASARPRASASEARNPSPPERVSAGRARSVWASRTSRSSPL